MTADERAKIFKALSDPRRLDMIDLLMQDGSLSGTEIARSLGISLALCCHHWEVLADAGVVKKERVGQLRMCSLDIDRIRQATGKWDAGSSQKVSRKKQPARRVTGQKQT